jgi:hypothetical protein
MNVSEYLHTHLHKNRDVFIVEKRHVCVCLWMCLKRVLIHCVRVMRMYMYMCMHVCLAHTWMKTANRNTCIHMHIHTYINIHAYTKVYRYTNSRWFCAHTYMHTYIHTLNTYIRTYTHACTRIPLDETNIHMHRYVNIHIHTHTYIRTGTVSVFIIRYATRTQIDTLVVH